MNIREDFIDDYIKNIKIKDIYMNRDFLGYNLIIKITDNNKKMFKNRAIKEFLLSIPESSKTLDKIVKSKIRNYVVNQSSDKIISIEISSLIIDYKKKYLKKEDSSKGEDI